MATRLRRRLRTVRKKISSVRLNDSPSRGPAIRPAKNVPVPGVASQETSNTAGSLYALRTTGGVRITWRCRPGTGGRQETESSTLPTGGDPQSTTNADSSRNGDQAFTMRGKVSGSATFVAGAAASPG